MYVKPVATYSVVHVNIYLLIHQLNTYNSETDRFY